jgi:sugar O-acyltransferase (sialic acid O-acetyltransferase NeuD family)
VAADVSGARGGGGGAPLLVVGAGGFARETVEAVRSGATDPSGRPWHVVGILDDDPRWFATVVAGVPVLGRPDLVHSHTAHVVVATGRPGDYASRARIVARLGLPPERYGIVVHPTAALAADTVLGPGTVVLAGVVATSGVRIGAHVALMPQVVLPHDDVVEDFATLTSGVRLGGGVTVETGAHLGAGAVVREGLRVGEWSQLGMGSMLTRHLPDRVVAYGSPAHVVRAASPLLPEAPG